MNNNVNDHLDSSITHCISKCTSPTIDTISLRAIRVLSVVVLLIGIVSIATQIACTSFLYEITAANGPSNLLETASYTTPGWAGALHIFLGGAGLIASIWPRRIFLILTAWLASFLIPLSVVALVLSGFSFLVRSHFPAGFKWELVQSVFIVCNSFGIFIAMALVVRIALAICRTYYSEYSESSSAISSLSPLHKKKLRALIRADLTAVRAFSVITINIGLLAIIVQAFSWLCLDLSSWFSFLQGFWDGVLNFLIGYLGLCASCRQTKPMFTGMVACCSISVAAAFLSFMLSVLSVFSGYSQCVQNCTLWFSIEWSFIILSTIAFSCNSVLTILASAHLCRSKFKTFEMINVSQASTFDPSPLHRRPHFLAITTYSSSLEPSQQTWHSLFNRGSSDSNRNVLRDGVNHAATNVLVRDYM